MKNNKLYTLDDTLKLSRSDIIDLHNEYLNSSLVKLLSKIDFTRQFVKAQDTQVWDSEGREYIDFLAGYGALNCGHNHPKITEVFEKIKNCPNLIQASLNTFAAALGHNLSLITPGDLQRSFFCNSGAEAVEGAIKLARISTGKTGIISAINSFHGKSLGALTATGKPKYQKLFQPLVPHFYYFPYGDIDALEKLIKTKETAAVILEPIQGEGGVIVPPENFLKEVRILCNKYKILFILDEIQTGFGRTGKLFACEYDDISPDIMCLAKSLGGGVVPIGAYITTDKVWSYGYGTEDKATLHSSTFGGNSIACAIGIASINTIIEEKLTENALEQGQYLTRKLKEIQEKYKFIKEVRGKGLLIGVEFQLPKGILNFITGGKLQEIAREYTGALFAGILMDKYQIITAYTLNNPNVIRLEPPLTIKKEKIDKLITGFEEICANNKSFIKLLISMSKNLLSMKEKK